MTTAPDLGHKFGAQAVANDGRASVRLSPAPARIAGQTAYRFIDVKQGLAWRALGIDHILALQLDVIEFQFVMLIGRAERDRGVADQASGRDQYTIDKQGMTLAYEKVGARNVGGERGARDSDRTCFLRPRFAQIASGPSNASCPHNRTESAKDGWDNVADTDVFRKLLIGITAPFRVRRRTPARQ